MTNPHFGKPCIICVAITGSLPTQENDSDVPITVAEQVESTQEAFEAGTAADCCHVRDSEDTPTGDPARFARLKEGLERHCPGMIMQLYSGGRSGSGQSRDRMLPLRPDMAWLTTGSNRSSTRAYENPPYRIVLNDWAVSSGGHARTRSGDNLRLDRDTLAPSNAALVRQVTTFCDHSDRSFADWKTASALLGLHQPVAA
jgi:uncharacterized protein (DUF849 family)